MSALGQKRTDAFSNEVHFYEAWRCLRNCGQFNLRRQHLTLGYFISMVFSGEIRTVALKYLFIGSRTDPSAFALVWYRLKINKEFLWLGCNRYLSLSQKLHV